MGFGDYLGQAFPGIRVTSSKRDPNSRLGRANPKSYHNVGMAWDVAPVEGMTFEQFRDRIGQDYDIKEAIDEVENPSRNATGPHWHVAVGNRKERQPVANGLAGMIAQPMQAPQAAPPQGIAAMLQRPLMDEQIQQGAVDPSAGFAEMAQLPGVKPKGRGTANDILGTIFDAMAAFGGGQPTYWAGVNEQQAQDEQGRQLALKQRTAAEQAKAQRIQELQDWMMKKQYEQQNPGPTNAARMAQEAGFQPGTPQFTQFVQQYAQRPIMIGGEAYGYGQPQQQATQTIDGQTYYNVNGKWFDNPEGR